MAGSTITSSSQPFGQADYYETAHHKQLIKDIKGAILEGWLIAVCGVVGSGKTITLRRLQHILKDEIRVSVAKSLSVEKHSIKLATLITALFYDLLQDKLVQIPKQGERRELELQELVKKGKCPVALFADEEHDLSGHTLIGLKRLMEVVEDGGGRLSVILAGPPKLHNDLRRPTMEEIGYRIDNCKLICSYCEPRTASNASMAGFKREPLQLGTANERDMPCTFELSIKNERDNSGEYWRCLTSEGGHNINKKLIKTAT